MSERSEDDAVFAEQTQMLKRHFEPVLTEPIPARMYLRQPAWMGIARASIVFVLGVAVGAGAMLARTPSAQAPSASTAPVMVARAARAHAVYTAEVRHAVEVDASQKDHLVRWLSKRVGHDLKIPLLSTEGFELLGGRLLPGDVAGGVAQFMYQDAAGKRLTLYVARRNPAERLTAFQFAKQGPVSVFYWIDKDCSYALSGEIDKPALARVATSVYQQLEP